MNNQVESAVKSEGIGNSNPMTFTSQEWKDMGYIDSAKASELLQSMPLLERLEVLQNTPLHHSPFEWHYKKAKKEIIQWYMNARATCSCTGHSKAARNEALVKKYGELMKKYNIPLPPDEICWVLGVFNGDGAS
jgi:hypothetical protein